MQYLGGYVFRRYGKIERATELFTCARQNATQLPILQRYCDYELAYSAFLRLEWQDALDRMIAFLGSMCIFLPGLSP